MPSRKSNPKSKSSTKSTLPRNRWSMYPALHTDVVTHLSSDTLSPVALTSLSFHPFDDSHSSKREYDTNIMGRFICTNDSCRSTGWTSKKIAITIRLYEGNEYNARVYHQRCKRCNALSRPFLDEESYAERIAYRMKRWYGVDVERPVYERKRTKPHNRELCEGCKAGRCSFGDVDVDVGDENW
ncbi:hypothetical protein AbraIFM66951_009847 [Aspergillus brasiliensis]|uniref:3CxxC-type domain-containing protein n=1 Tax=Aspergillus brasiliensis TaxID=319629 RepID=A0A9W5YVN7_9EURO|nr:hypothetical protein AbraCBS73388_010139 [Aspergillus brasiliensis]GKZ46703.1 hypothetical protein AbraIFM66951_009847 [Aspergillus brasiliensis]